MRSAQSAPLAASAHPGVGFVEFVALIAALMAIPALGIDSMLPALPHIGAALGVHSGNQRQWIITAYLLGFGAAQIVYGSLSDRYGRKPIILWSVLGYVLFSLLGALSTNFALLIAARAAQGIAGAATRVIVISVVRDCYEGRQMARVMSLASMVFLIVPILAPGVGTLILMVAPWRWIFGLLAGGGTIIAIWTALRFPETLDPARRRPLSVAAVHSATQRVLSDRFSLGYTLAQTAILGALFGFINSAQQIFFDIFHAPRLFPIVFAVAAGTMAATSLLNARIVVRHGMRRVSQAAMIGFILVAAVHLVIVLSGRESLAIFAVLQALSMGCFGLAMSNFGTISMEPLGEIAGAAASIQGVLINVGGTAIGFAIGQGFNGTTLPLIAGYLILGSVGLLIVAITEQGRLFAPHQHDEQAPGFVGH